MKSERLRRSLFKNQQSNLLIGHQTKSTVDQNRERAYNQIMEDMLKLADASCEKVCNVAWTSAEELDKMMQQYEQLAEEVFWNALGVSIKYNG